MAMRISYSLTSASTDLMFSCVGAQTIMGRPAALAYSNWGRRESTVVPFVISTLPPLVTVKPAASNSARPALVAAAGSPILRCTSLMLMYLTCIFLSISMAVGRSKLRREYVAIPSLTPQGSGSMTAEAGVAPIAASPPIEVAAPRKLRREVSIRIDPCLQSKINSTPWQAVLVRSSAADGVVVGDDGSDQSRARQQAVPGQHFISRSEHWYYCVTKCVCHRCGAG